MAVRWVRGEGGGVGGQREADEGVGGYKLTKCACVCVSECLRAVSSESWNVMA